MPASPILVATDLKPRCDRAVDRALMLGRQLARPVCLVHVRERGADEEDSAEVERAARDSLPDPDAAVELLLPAGTAAPEICHAAHEWDAAVVVCAVARFSTFREYVTGTTVDRILAQGGRPVLVVKQRPRADYRKLMAAVDFSDYSAEALAIAARLFPDAEIVLVHAYHVAFETSAHLREEARAKFEEAMRAFLDRPELAGLRDRTSAEFVYGAIGPALLGAARDLAPDLVVAGTRGGGLRRAALGSIATQMLRWMPQDMLVIPPED